MKSIVSTSNAIIQGVLALSLTTLFGCLFNWIGFSFALQIFSPSASSVLMWTLATLFLFVAMPLAYFYFSLFYAKKIAFRKIYIDHNEIIKSLCHIIMKQVIKVVKAKHALDKQQIPIKKILQDYLKTWPWLMRICLKAVLFFIPLWEMIKDLDRNKMNDEHLEELSESLFLKVDIYIKEEILSLFPWFTLWLVPVNIGLMYLISLLG